MAVASIQGPLVFGVGAMVDARMANEVSAILPALRTVMDGALEHGRRLTDGGRTIDEHQVHAERLAYAATEVKAAEALAAYAAARREAGAPDETTDAMAGAFAGEVAAKLRGAIEAHRDDFGVADDLLARTLASTEVTAAVRAAQHESRFREIGREIIRSRGANNGYIDGDVAEMARDSARAFARKEVAPLAEHIHRHDDLVPESIIGAMRELGYFGMSVPEEYGGQGMGNLPMIIITEELSHRLARGRRQPDHAPGDPDQGAAQGRDGCAEASLAAARGGGRADGRHLGDGAGHRLRRGVGALSRGAWRAGRRGRLVHQRRQGLVHVRGPRRRARAARAHGSRSQEGRARPVALHRPEGCRSPVTSSR